MPLSPEFWDDGPPPKEPPPETESQKNQRLLLEALQAPGGREKLGAAMAAPIRARLRPFGQMPPGAALLFTEPSPVPFNPLTAATALLPWDGTTETPFATGCVKNLVSPPPPEEEEAGEGEDP